MSICQQLYENLFSVSKNILLNSVIPLAMKIMASDWKRIKHFHTILMKLVREVVKDRRVLRLIRGWLTAGVMEEGNIRYGPGIQLQRV